MKDRNKKLALIAVIVVAAALIIGAAAKFGYKFMSEKLDARKDAVQAALQTEDGCNEANLAELESLYGNFFSRNRDKALYAEQIARCKLVDSDYAGAKTWLERAKSKYEDEGEEEKVKLLEADLETLKLLSETPAIIEGVGSPEGDTGTQ